jgi:hypothetical protein
MIMRLSSSAENRTSVAKPVQTIVFTNIKKSTGLKKSLKMATDPVRETQCVKRQ